MFSLVARTEVDGFACVFSSFWLGAGAGAGAGTAAVAQISGFGWLCSVLAALCVLG